jgi:hypothetical protein
VEAGKVRRRRLRSTPVSTTLPIGVPSHGLTRSHEAGKLGQIAEAQFVVKAEEHHERNDIRRMSGAIEEAAATLVELPATIAAAGLPISPMP